MQNPSKINQYAEGEVERGRKARGVVWPAIWIKVAANKSKAGKPNRTEVNPIVQNILW